MPTVYQDRLGKTPKQRDRFLAVVRPGRQLGEAHKPFLAVGNEPANRRVDDAGRTRGGSRSVAAAAAAEKQQVGLACAARGGRALPAPATKAARCGLYLLRRRRLLLWSYAWWQQRSDADASQHKTIPGRPRPACGDSCWRGHVRCDHWGRAHRCGGRQLRYVVRKRTSSS
jgi:hypothetical protein